MLAAFDAGAAGNPAEAVEMGRVDVVGNSPLPGLGMPLESVPANVQVFRAPSGRDRFATLPALLERLAAGTTLASGQGNPFQPDFAYRGFVASPLVGQPQGVTVFQDGVRLNEPFGDVVNWDLVPAAAIGSAQLVPGSTPLFGPNALGGVVSLYTKSGADWPGGALEARGGSFGRRAIGVEQGASRGAWDAYGAADALNEDGWARHQASRLRRAFAKIGHQTDSTDLDVSATLADNTLHGVQALPVSFLDDIRQPYTWPDFNRNRLAMLAAKGSAFIARDVLLGATAYARRSDNENFSTNTDDGVEREAANDLSRIAQRGEGLGAQLTVARPLGRLANTFIAGASVDVGRARYTRDEQDATITGDREIVGIAPFTPQVDARTATRRRGAFVSDALQPVDGWTFVGSLRYDVVDVEIADRSGQAPELEGRHRFSRLDPGIGATWQAGQGFAVFGAYAEGMRAPTAMELTCADPGAPCRLPNAFLADPPLRAVVSRTAEAGARMHSGDAFAATFTAWRTDADDDIQFVASDASLSSAGYFRNVGRTRRQGIEAAASWRREAWTLGARYAFTDATFRTAFRESSPNHAHAAPDGTLEVRPGNRIPGIPRHALRLSGAWSPSPSRSVELSVVAASGQRARGDESNDDPRGRVPGYAVAGIDARWALTRAIDLVASVDNLFDARYSRSGLLGRNFFADDARTFAPASARTEAFRGVGAPRGAWLGVRWHWD